MDPPGEPVGLDDLTVERARDLVRSCVLAACPTANYWSAAASKIPGPTW